MKIVRLSNGDWPTPTLAGLHLTVLSKHCLTAISNEGAVVRDRRQRTRSFIYIRTQNLTSAKNVAARIVDRGESPGLFPLAGVPFRPSGRRKLTVVNYPYVIYYRINSAANEVEILNVRHTARKQLPTKE